MIKKILSYEEKNLGQSSSKNPSTPWEIVVHLWINNIHQRINSLWGTNHVAIRIIIGTERKYVAQVIKINIYHNYRQWQKEMPCVYFLDHLSVLENTKESSRTGSSLIRHSCGRKSSRRVYSIVNAEASLNVCNTALYFTSSVLFRFLHPRLAHYLFLSFFYASRWLSTLGVRCAFTMHPPDSLRRKKYLLSDGENTSNLIPPATWDGFSGEDSRRAIEMDSSLGVWWTQLACIDLAEVFSQVVPQEVLII